MDMTQILIHEMLFWSKSTAKRLNYLRFRDDKTSSEQAENAQRELLRLKGKLQALSCVPYHGHTKQDVKRLHKLQARLYNRVESFYWKSVMKWNAKF